MKIVNNVGELRFCRQLINNIVVLISNLELDGGIYSFSFIHSFDAVVRILCGLSFLTIITDLSTSRVFG